MSLVSVLRAKFGGDRRKLCAALGIDEALLEEEVARLRKLRERGPRLGFDARGNRFGRDQEMPNGGSPTVSAAHSLRAAIEEALAGYEGDLPEGLARKLLEAAEKHAPMDAGDEEPDRRAELAELARREQHGGSGGAAALDCESAAEFLRSKGVDEETIKSAVGMVKDAFPPNALPNGGALGRGAGPGAKFAQKRVGMDERINKRLGIRLPDVGAAAADHAIDRRPVPSAARLERMFDRFPGMRNIGVHGG